MSEQNCITTYLSSAILLQEMSQKNCSTICRQQLYYKKCLRKTAAQSVVCNFTTRNVCEKLQHNLSSATLLQEMSEKKCSTICRLQLYCRKCLRKTAAQSVVRNFTTRNVCEKLQHNLSSATLLQEMSAKNCRTICRLQLYCRKCLRKTAAQYVVCNFTVGNVCEKLQHNLSSSTLLLEMSAKNCSTIGRLQLYCRKCLRKTAAPCRLQLYCRKCLRKTAAQSVVFNFTVGNVCEKLQHNLSSATLL